MATTDDKKKKIIQLLGEGKTPEAACGIVGVSRRTYYNWRKSDPDFAAQCDFVTSSNKAARQEERRKNAETRREQRAREMEGDPEEYTGVEIRFRPYEGGDPDKMATAHARELREALREKGSYSKMLEPQIRAAAHLWVSAQMVWTDLPKCAPLQGEISREGNLRMAANPLYGIYKAQMESYTAALRALGLNLLYKQEGPTATSRAGFFEGLDDD